MSNRGRVKLQPPSRPSRRDSGSQSYRRVIHRNHLPPPQTIEQIPCIRDQFPEYFPLGVRPGGVTDDREFLHGVQRVSEQVRTSEGYDPKVEWARDKSSYKPVPSRRDMMYYCPSCTRDLPPASFLISSRPGPLGVVCTDCRTTIAVNAPVGQLRVCHSTLSHFEVPLFGTYHGGCARLLPAGRFLWEGREGEKCQQCMQKRFPTYVHGDLILRGPHADLTRWFTG